jgi:hypothetical protein
MLSEYYLMLRSACRARLEARPTAMQPFPLYSFQFFSQALKGK